MNENKAIVLFMVSILSMLTLGGRDAWGHGLGWQAERGGAITVRFAYDDESPMMYGAVEVFAPGGEHEYQNGRTDENGYFAFRPNRPGKWVVTGSDGQGHALRADIDVTDTDLTDVDAPSNIVQIGGATRPGIERIILGLSLLLNLGLVFAWRLAKRKV